MLKVVQTWFVRHETWHTTLFGIYIIFVEMVRIEHNSVMLGNAFKVAFFRFLKFFFALTHLNPLQHGLFGIKLGPQQYFLCIIVLKCLELKTIFICLMLRSKLHF